MDQLIGFLSGTCLFLAIASIVFHYTKNLIVPFVGWMLIIGTSYSILRTKTEIFTDWPPLTLDPEIVLHLLVPLLIFESGRKFGIRDFEKEKIPITFFSIIGVILTVFLFGYPISLLLNIPLTHGLLLGAIIAPTDPIAVNAVFTKFIVPKRLKVQMEGESLFNDATGVLLFTMMFGIAIENQQASPDNAIFFFLWSIGIAMLIGSLMGWIVGTLLNTWKENELAGTILTLSLAIAASLITETVFHASGIIGALFSAMVFMKTETTMGKSEWKTFDTFWNHIGVVSNSVLFFLLGSSLGQQEFFMSWVLLWAVILLAVSRIIVVYGGGLILRVIHNKIPLSWQNILYFGGIRGAISVALLLTIPEDYVYRDPFLSIAFVLIIFTLILNPIFINRYLSKHNLEEVSSDDEITVEIKAKIKIKENP